MAADYGCSKMEDLYAALGYGKFSARQVLQKLVPSLVPPETPETSGAVRTHAHSNRATHPWAATKIWSSRSRASTIS